MKTVFSLDGIKNVPIISFKSTLSDVMSKGKTARGSFPIPEVIQDHFDSFVRNSKEKQRSMGAAEIVCMTPGMLAGLMRRIIPSSEEEQINGIIVGFVANGTCVPIVGLIDEDDEYYELRTEEDYDLPAILKGKEPVVHPITGEIVECPFLGISFMF